MQRGWKRRTLNLGWLVVRVKKKQDVGFARKIQNMGRQALISHCNRKKHKEIDVKIKLFFQPVNKSLVSPLKASENETVRVGVLEQPTSSKTQATLELVVTTRA